MSEEFRAPNEIIEPNDVVDNYPPEVHNGRSYKSLRRGSELLESLAQILNIDDVSLEEWFSSFNQRVKDSLRIYPIQTETLGELILEFNILKANENFKGWQKGELRFKVNIEIDGRILDSEPIFPESPLDDIRREIQSQKNNESES